MRRFVALSSTTRTWRPARSGSARDRAWARWPSRRIGLDRQPEGAALARDAGALRDERAVHQLRQPPADGEAQAGAAVAARDRRVRLAERLEQPAASGPAGCRCRCRGLGRELPARQARRARARTAVGRPRAARPRPRSVNLTALESRLRTIWRSRPGVADDRARQVVLDGVGELDALGGRRRREHVQRALDARARGRTAVLQLHLAGLDLREVEDVVDDRSGAPRPRCGSSRRSRAARRRAACRAAGRSCR